MSDGPPYRPLFHEVPIPPKEEPKPVLHRYSTYNEWREINELVRGMAKALKSMPQWSFAYQGDPYAGTFVLSKNCDFCGNVHQVSGTHMDAIRAPSRVAFVQDLKAKVEDIVCTLELGPAGRPK